MGETGDDTKLESSFGDGAVNYDPASPRHFSSGLDFRWVNCTAFFIYKFSKVASRKFRIVLSGGKNPYFIINFATNRFHNFMAAGIGGWRVKKLLNDSGRRSYRDICSVFRPDIFINALGANDDWTFPARKVQRIIKGVTEAELKCMPLLELNSASFDGKNFTVVKNTGLISQVGENFLVSPNLKGANIVAGDIVRIGNYYGDNDSVVTREIESFDPVNCRITWLRNMYPQAMFCVEKFEDLIGAEFAVRSLKQYEEQYKTLIRKLREINPAMKIFVVNMGYPCYFLRQLWGYDLVQRRVVGQFSNCGIIDVTNHLGEFQRQHVSGCKFIKLQTDGSQEYKLPWKGHWQGFSCVC